MKKILLLTLAALLLFSDCAGPAAQPTQAPAETPVSTAAPQTAAPAAETAPVPAEEPEGVYKTGSMKLEYANQFSVDNYSDGSALLTIGEDRFLILPEGIAEPGFETNAVIIRRPLSHIYMAASSAMDLISCLDSMDKIRFTVIRGNISEIKTLALGSGTTKGVDADVADAVTEESLDSAVKFAKDLASKTGSVIAITGAIDLVADADRCYVIRNGRPEMGRITGTGCQLSGMMTAFVVANPDNALEAAAASVCAMGLAGEIGYSHLASYEGNSTYRNRIIDAICNMDGKCLDEGAKFEVR